MMNRYNYKSALSVIQWIVFLVLVFGVPVVAETYNNYHYLWMWLALIPWGIACSD